MLSVFLGYCFCFLGQYHSLTCDALIKLGQLTNELRASAFLHSSKTGVTEA